MPRYVDGFVIPLPKDKVESYRTMAAKAAKVWMKHGALSYKESIGEDLAKSEHCQSFPAGIGAKEGETVVFAWILYESRESRDKVNAAVMQDPEITGMCESGEMPFDCQRMLYGGFELMVDE